MNIQGIEIAVHKYNLNNIKKEIKNCTYIAHEETKVKDSETNEIKIAHLVIAKVRNNSGGIDIIKFPLECTPQKMGQKEYDFILENLKNRDYGVTI